jgi:hypothetical protein
MAYVPSSTALGIQALNATSSVQKGALGRIIQAIDPVYGAGEFVYLKGVVGTLVGSLVTYDQNLGITVLAPATGGKGPLAVAMSANVANQFGWYQISGAAAVLAPNAMTPGAGVFMLAATPGSVDDAQVNGAQVLNAVVSTTTGSPSAGLAIIQMNRPFYQGQVV